MEVDKITEKDVARAQSIFKALSNPVRMKLLYALEGGEQNVSTIANSLDLEQSVVSHQLAALRKNYLVASERIGKQVFYRLDDRHVLDILDSVMEHVQHTE
ncbi:metalloregulator ArsR/SmtB family transcription factor [Ligilactobacillus pobuzihii]|uniref:ArsR/SmtB family transcription factor n=1 Tax=Ligilactobacillus pobuzihii TaxID=449659 RepID=UPI0019D2EA43|nr:metalloregulator ArsR/SmtB family transcription factor [Ligilactobacillus pobuzihii]MBN7273991.1 metalloregulator ArsR/SmtB family transcription factor [Ligilactobacillus pobuzihii]